MGNDAYDEILAKFARKGAEIIRTDPRTHYQKIGQKARGPMVPGYIPIDRAPLLTTISYHPIESSLQSPERTEARTRARELLLRWGETGGVAEYVEAYRARMAFRDQVAFNRRWLDPLLAMLEIRPDEIAWLPLIKCPLMEDDKVDKEDRTQDLHALWDQLELIRPTAVLIQSKKAYDVVGKRLDNLKFIRVHPMQNLSRYRNENEKEQELITLCKELKPEIDSLIRERGR